MQQSEARNFAIYKTLKNIETLPAKVMMNILQSFVKPSLVYGSDVWGVNMNAIKALDKVSLWHAC